MLSRAQLLATPKAFVREATGLVRDFSAFDSLMINLVAIGVLFSFTNVIFAAEFYSGANLIVSAVVALLLCIPYASLYIIFSIAMPRSGGDYVWVSRSLSPVLGFLANFYITLIILSFSGITTGWGFQYGLGPMFQSFYQLSGNSFYQHMATTFANTNYDFLSSVVVSGVSGYLIIRGTRKLAWFQWIAGLGSIVGALIFVAVLFAANPATVASNFSTYAGVSYASVLSTAASQGISTGFTANGTLLGSVYAALTLIAFMYSSYFAGEVKRVRRSQIIAQYGSLVTAAALQVLIAAALYHAFGSDFISAISQLGLTSSYPLPLLPFGQYLLGFVTNNFLIIGVVNVCFMVMCWGACAAYIFTSSRNIFAWSFDRVIPSRLSTVGSRYGSPYLVVAVATAISMTYAFLDYYTTVLSTVLSYSLLGWWIAVFIVALAGIVFPFRRRDIFDSSPTIVKIKLGGLPLVSLLGGMLAVIAAFLAYSVISPAYVGVLNATYVYAVIVLLLLGVVIFYISYAYHRRKGLSLDLAYREVPPE
jgi:amino acid transporter